MRFSSYDCYNVVPEGERSVNQIQNGKLFGYSVGSSMKSFNRVRPFRDRATVTIKHEIVTRRPIEKDPISANSQTSSVHRFVTATSRPPADRVARYRTSRRLSTRARARYRQTRRNVCPFDRSDATVQRRARVLISLRLNAIPF